MGMTEEKTGLELEEGPGYSGTCEVSGAFQMSRRSCQLGSWMRGREGLETQIWELGASGWFLRRQDKVT